MERQLRDRVLEACCEEQAEKFARQEARAVEVERARKKRVQWADVEDELDSEGRVVCQDLGGGDEEEEESRMESLEGQESKAAEDRAARREWQGEQDQERRAAECKPVEELAGQDSNRCFDVSFANDQEKERQERA